MSSLIHFLVKATTDVFILGIRLAAPVMALLLTSVVLGIMARAFPQMNIFMVSFPLNIGLGFMVLGMTLLLFFHVELDTAIWLSRWQQSSGCLQRGMISGEDDDKHSKTEQPTDQEARRGSSVFADAQPKPYVVSWYHCLISVGWLSDEWTAKYHRTGLFPDRRLLN